MTPSDSHRTERSIYVVGKFFWSHSRSTYQRLAIVRKHSSKQALRRRKTDGCDYTVIVLYILSGLGGELSLSYRHKILYIDQKEMWLVSNL